MNLAEYLQAMIEYLDKRINERIYLCLLAKTPYNKAKLLPSIYLLNMEFLSADYAHISFEAYQYILENSNLAVHFGGVKRPLIHSVWWDDRKETVYSQRQRIAFLKHLKDMYVRQSNGK